MFVLVEVDLTTEKITNWGPTSPQPALLRTHSWREHNDHLHVVVECSPGPILKVEQSTLRRAIADLKARQ